MTTPTPPAVVYGLTTSPTWARDVAVAYADLIRTGTHFAQVSYREGVWYCMLEIARTARNTNGEEYDPRLSAKLRDTLIDYQGQWCVFWPPRDVARALRREADHWRRHRYPRAVWIPDRPIGRAVERGYAAPFFDALREKRVIVVGPSHLKDLPPGLLGEYELVEIPLATAWLRAERTARRLLDTLTAGTVVLIAGGMATNLIVHRVWPEVRGEVTLYDIGAALDPYAGVYSRPVYRHLGWQTTIMPLNVPTP